VSTTERQLQDLLDAIHGLSPASLTIDQLATVLAAVRFAVSRWQSEYQMRLQAVARRREMGVAA
jgi:hypothetical protein